MLSVNVVSTNEFCKKVIAKPQMTAGKGTSYELNRRQSTEVSRKSGIWWWYVWELDDRIQYVHRWKWWNWGKKVVILVHYLWTLTIGTITASHDVNLIGLLFIWGPIGELEHSQEIEWVSFPWVESIETRKAIVDECIQLYSPTIVFI